jgi:hypothetical protein
MVAEPSLPSYEGLRPFNDRTSQGERGLAKEHQIEPIAELTFFRPHNAVLPQLNVLRRVPKPLVVKKRAGVADAIKAGEHSHLARSMEKRRKVSSAFQDILPAGTVMTLRPLIGVEEFPPSVGKAFKVEMLPKLPRVRRVSQDDDRDLFGVNPRSISQAVLELFRADPCGRSLAMQHDLIVNPLSDAGFHDSDEKALAPLSAREAQAANRLRVYGAPTGAR